MDIRHIILVLVTISDLKADMDVNLALNKPTSQSSDYLQYFAAKAADGDTNGDFLDNSCTHTSPLNDIQEWWEIDLQAVYDITDLIIYNRVDCCGDRLKNFTIEGGVDCGGSQCYTQCYSQTEAIESSDRITCNFCTARYVRISLLHEDELTLCEVEIYGLTSNSTAESHSCSKYSSILSSIEPSTVFTSDVPESTFFLESSWSSNDWIETTSLDYSSTVEHSSSQVPQVTNTSTTETFTNDFCSCTCKKIDDNPEVIAEKLTELKENLTISTVKLSSSIRRRTSAVDSRPSATSVGYIGIVMLSLVGGFMVLSDIVSVVAFFVVKIKSKLFTMTTNVTPIRVLPRDATVIFEKNMGSSPVVNRVCLKTEAPVKVHLINTPLGCPPSDARLSLDDEKLDMVSPEDDGLENVSLEDHDGLDKVSLEDERLDKVSLEDEQ